VIARWLKRTGQDPRAEYVVRRAIARNGIRPRPYLFPALERERASFAASVRRFGT
jgi:hypothetical protein